jgi:hypothetical protein
LHGDGGRARRPGQNTYFLPAAGLIPHDDLVVLNQEIVTRVGADADAVALDVIVLNVV